MPTVFIYKGYKFFFYSNEGEPRKPRHIHIRKGTYVAKYWIEPEVRLESAWGLNPKELNKLEKVVEEKIDLIKEAWDEYFG